jgi:hypothetical protein
MHNMSQQKPHPSKQPTCINNLGMHADFLPARAHTSRQFVMRWLIECGSAGE